MRDNDYRGHEDVATAERRTQRMLQRNLLITLAFAAAMYLLSGLWGQPMKLELGPVSLAVTAPDKHLTAVSYADITGIEVVDAPDFGEPVEGKRDSRCWYGTWQNDAWGSYYLCVHPKAARCCAIEIKGSRYVVINGSSDQETDRLVEAIEGRMSAE